MQGYGRDDAAKQCGKQQRQHAERSAHHWLVRGLLALVLLEASQP
jgi:hypothetical protein